MLIRRFENQARRDGARIGSDHVALPVDVLNAKRGIDGRLVGIGGGSGEVVEVEARKELILGGELMIDAQRKLIGVGGDLRRGRVSVRAKRAGGIVGQRIARQHGRDAGIDGDRRACQWIHQDR